MAYVLYFAIRSTLAYSRHTVPRHSRHQKHLGAIHPRGTSPTRYQTHAVQDDCSELQETDQDRPHTPWNDTLTQAMK